MGRAVWGADPEFFGPRHAHRESRIARALADARPGDGPHLDCAAGVGSLALTLARSGRTVVAADMSLRSLAVVRRRAQTVGLEAGVLTVLADVTRLPFADGAFASVTSAETLEHIEADGNAASELARVLRPDGVLVSTVPADPSQWSDWDDWAGHLRRYTAGSFERLLTGAGFEARVTTWGWPVVRLYDGLFLKRVNRRRLRSRSGVEADPALRTVAGAGRSRLLIKMVRAAFSLDRLFDGSARGVGLLAVARRLSRSL